MPVDTLGAGQYCGIRVKTVKRTADLLIEGHA